jgi:uncharacterized phage protein (TIGR01671 family)
MNREIKFRGKRIDNGEWVYGFYVREEGLKGDGFHSISHTIITKREPFRLYQDRVYADTIGQDTGLKDRNGVKIWEGDVFHLGDPNILYVVVWQDAGLVGRQRGNRSSVGLSYWAPYLEIVGNIHDNPEMLEVS